MQEPFITIVIAAKSPPPEKLCLCITSITSQNSAKEIEAILVLPTGETLPGKQNNLDRLHSFRTVHTAPKGVYDAYNFGTKLGNGIYTMYLGADDLLLPDFEYAVQNLQSNNKTYELAAFSTYMQGKGFHAPMLPRFTILFRNWCHQGILYNTETAKKRPYNTKYKTQADHKLNIELLSDPKNKVFVNKTIVSYFSDGGISNTRPDTAFRQDLPKLARTRFGLLFSLLVSVKQKLANLAFGSPENRFNQKLENK